MRVTTSCTIFEQIASSAHYVCVANNRAGLGRLRADKVFKPSERIDVQFRAEIFNLFGQAHFYAPGFNVFSGSAGHITTLISSPGGRLTQLGLKVNF